MNPVSWTKKKRGFYMGKLSYDDKIKLYEERKNGLSLKSLSIKYEITTKNAQYFCCLIDKHGLDILRTIKNESYPKKFKEEAVNRVLINHESVWSVSLDLGFSNDGLLQNWIKKYKENGYNIVERKRGRSTMQKKPTKQKKNETIEEKVKRLEEENLYLKAELDYSKKLRVVVQARKNQQQKKK